MNSRDQGHRRAAAVTAGLTAASVVAGLGLSVLARTASSPTRPLSTMLSDEATTADTSKPAAGSTDRRTATGTGTGTARTRHSGASATKRHHPAAAPPLTVVQGNGGGQAVTQGS